MDTTQFNNIHDPIARAEAMRAQAVAEIILNGANALRGFFKAAAAKLEAHLEYRRTYETLSAMTDRELDDIGIGRGDIAAVARGFDPRKQAGIALGDALAQRLALAKAFDQAEEVRKPVVHNDEHRTAAAA